VAWGRKHGVRLVPRCGGHSYGGYSTTSSGVVVDVTRMNYVQPRPGGTAFVGAGALLIDVYSTLWAQHRMIPGGSCPTVGISGFTLGGGHGFSSRKFGLGCDNVKQVTIVTADGQVRVCNAHQNADLYWACRGGGGGNFGIVTNFTFKTHAVDGVSTFSIRWPWSDAEAAFAAWQAWAPHAPRNLGLSVMALSSSGPSITATGQFFGPTEALRSLIRPLAEVGSPTVSVVPRTFFEAVLHYASCGPLSQCHTPPREAFKSKSDYARHPFSAAGIKAMVRGIETFGSGAVILLLDSYGGAINAVPKAATAFVHRNMLFSMQYHATPGSPANIRALNGFYKAMRPYVSGFAYQNYIDPQLKRWPHAYYGSNYARLVAVKRKYDPTNFFHFAQSIRRHT
jgi:FAD binding domain/Berberine and berberine like